MSINPAEYEKFLGHTFVTRSRQIAFQVGDKSWSRYELAQAFGIPHFKAAGNLTIQLRKLGVKSLEQLYTIGPDELADVKGIGETGAYVAASILKEHDFDVKRWTGCDGAGNPTVTYRTLKNRHKTNGKGNHGHHRSVRRAVSGARVR